MVGGLIGFVLCPISLTSLAGPFCHLFPPAFGFWFGRVLLVTAALIFLCNLYLSCRRFVVQGSASYFPLFAALAASGGVAAIYGGNWYLPALLGFAILDLIGLPIVAGIVIGLTRLEPCSDADQH